MYIYYNGRYAEMNRVSDNYFMLQADYGIAFSLPTTLLITSILGDQVQDTLAISTPSARLSKNFPKKILALSMLSTQR